MHTDQHIITQTTLSQIQLITKIHIFNYLIIAKTCLKITNYYDINVYNCIVVTNAANVTRNFQFSTYTHSEISTKPNNQQTKKTKNKYKNTSKVQTKKKNKKHNKFTTIILTNTDNIIKHFD